MRKWSKDSLITERGYCRWWKHRGRYVHKTTDLISDLLSGIVVKPLTMTFTPLVGDWIPFILPILALIPAANELLSNPSRVIGERSCKILLNTFVLLVNEDASVNIIATNNRHTTRRIISTWMYDTRLSHLQDSSSCLLHSTYMLIVSDVIPNHFASCMNQHVRWVDR